MMFPFFLLFSFFEILGSNENKKLSNIYNIFFGKNGFFKKKKYIVDFTFNDNFFILRYIDLFKVFFLKKFKEKKFFYYNNSKNIFYEFYFYNILFFSSLSFGKLHPITQGIKRILYFFQLLGFSHVDGKEIETKKFNFFLLNISDDHSASSDTDTFYFTNSILLRTHTSSVQIREMKKNLSLPYNFISIGKVYRKDYDLTHTPMFFQTEGLVVSNNATMSHLVSILFKFLSFFYNSLVKIRVRSTYFPFTEPSFEVDINCFYCCSLNFCFFCRNTGWLEVLGAGCVHHRVLNNCSIDFKKYNGFAFGLGVDRLLSVYYKIFDIRLNFFNDLDYLEQF